MKIYLDLDGVLANFDKQYELLFGVRPRDVEKRKKHFYDNWDEFVLGGNFAKLEMLPNSRKLLEAVDALGVPVEILSSSGGPKHHECVVTQKLAWLRDNDLKYKPNIVPGGWKKADHAQPWHILIDDSAHVIEPYVQAGGTAILHSDHTVDDTIKKLYELHLEWVGGQ